MKLIGLTGGIASGKSLVESLLRKAHIPVVDADALAREVTAKNTLGLSQIISRFGESYLLPDGSLDRNSLAHLVFADDAARLELERITHPLISQMMQEKLQELASSGHNYCVYSAALIFEKNMQDAFSAVLLVYCDEATQIERLVKRDGMTKDQAIARISAQMPLIQKLEKTPYIIDNNGTPDQIAHQLSAAWVKITGQGLSFAA